MKAEFRRLTRTRMPTLVNSPLGNRFGRFGAYNGSPTYAGGGDGSPDVTHLATVKLSGLEATGIATRQRYYSTANREPASFVELQRRKQT